MIKPSFDNSVPEVSKSGYFKLSWSPGAVTAADNQNKKYMYKVLQATDPTFVDYDIKYEGPDKATFITGLPDGSYYYRVSAISVNPGNSENWSQAINVKVQHHSLRLATTLFFLGAVVFISTVALVLYGNFKINARG